MPTHGMERLAQIRRSVASAGGIALLVAAGGLALAVQTASYYIEQSARPYLYEVLDEVPERPVGLLLGTSRNRGHGLNEFYAARIAAAAELYHGNKIEHIIASGSNPSPYYNEPVDMKRDLVGLAVPERSITEDSAGLRTLDSVVRAHRVLGQDSFLIVSQRFHAARAVFLARTLGLDAVGFCAKDPPGSVPWTFRLREFGARFKAVLDVTVLGTQPAQLGEPRPIQLMSSAVQQTREGATIR